MTLPTPLTPNPSPPAPGDETSPRTPGAGGEGGQSAEPRGFLATRLHNWKLRHQLPFNFWIHVLLGIPLAYPVTIALLVLGWWWWAAGAFVLGFFLQWVGHCAEGNDVGEWAAIKRLFGLPYVGIAPRWNPDDPNKL
ncbi:MAG: DUF962 domain-containing protein [Gemmataceae bacterium]|nr:DUF962 domain-containing protein [Gemmataceae bacterium]